MLTDPTPTRIVDLIQGAAPAPQDGPQTKAAANQAQDQAPAAQTAPAPAGADVERVRARVANETADIHARFAGARIGK